MKKSMICCAIVALLIGIVSCGDSKKKENKNEEKHVVTTTPTKQVKESEKDVVDNSQTYKVFPGEYDIVMTDDLVNYFNELKDLGYNVGARDSEKPLVDKAVAELEKYAKGNRKYYPEEDVEKALDVMVNWEKKNFKTNSFSNSSVFLFRFMEQAARLCPNVEFLADFSHKDKKLGVINYALSSSDPLYSILIYKSGNGCKLKMIGIPGEVKVEKIFYFGQDGNEYYLCSNNSTKNDIGDFCQFLYAINNGEAMLLTSTMRMPYVDDLDGIKNYKIVFNPSDIRWDYCTKKDKYYHKIKNTPSLQLVLSGKNSYFVEN